MSVTIITGSGADYVFEKGFCYHRGDNLGAVLEVKRIPDTEIRYGEETLGEIRERMVVCEPEDIQVGDRFYVTCISNWRLASKVVEVKR